MPIGKLSQFLLISLYNYSKFLFNKQKSTPPIIIRPGEVLPYFYMRSAVDETYPTAIRTISLYNKLLAYAINYNIKHESTVYVLHKTSFDPRMGSQSVAFAPLNLSR